MRNEVFSTLTGSYGKVGFFSLEQLKKQGISGIDKLPFTIKILLENALRNCDGKLVSESDVRHLASWKPGKNVDKEFPFIPSRVLLQDFTGVPCVADLAAMRAAIQRMGGDSSQVNPLVPVDLVIDHSVQVDFFGSTKAFELNVEREYERNRERYAFLRWAQKAFRKFRVVPPGMGIVHQVNLEFLSPVVQVDEYNEEKIAFPDTLVGTDSHTTMINGLGVLGWGVGGIEAEACMLGQPLFMMLPDVIGFKLHGRLREGVTATDLVLTVTQMLRKKEVVGKFVEFFGTGLGSLSLADRATVANMAPEYGATVGYFPVDAQTLQYLRQTNRPENSIKLVEDYMKAQGLFRTDASSDPMFSDQLELDIGTVEPSLAGPKRPQDRVPLRELKKSVETALQATSKKSHSVDVNINGQSAPLKDGSVVVAAITSCTNTSNPSVMIAAGLLARKALDKGLSVPRTVKTSLAPGSRVVTDYLNDSGLTPCLEKLGFHLVGYGCTTCIGNSGPLLEPITEAIKKNDLSVAAVLSGNRNFEGRVHPLATLNYLASPPLVVAYALAGRVDINLDTDPIGVGKEGKPVYLKDIWPSQKEIDETIHEAFTPSLFQKRYSKIFDGDSEWSALPVPEGELYAWDPKSTYILQPPYFTDFGRKPSAVQDIKSARVLAVLGDSITTDHISPAGSIPLNSPAGQYLTSHGVKPVDFNSYGSRRGNHEVMIRGTFGNIRLKNLLVPDKEGAWTQYLPTGETTTIYDAAMKYIEQKIPLLVIAGKEYGSGSSRDWAAKGVMLLGVRAVLAESFERIHRSNLVGMGVLPLEFIPGENRESLRLTGLESYDIDGIAHDLTPQKIVSIRVTSPDGKVKQIKAKCRIDNAIEVEYYQNGGILPTVLRQILARSKHNSKFLNALEKAREEYLKEGGLTLEQYRKRRKKK